MNDEVMIRLAVPEDAQELVNIYSPYVEQTAVSFEYEPPRSFSSALRGIAISFPI